MNPDVCLIYTSMLNLYFYVMSIKKLVFFKSALKVAFQVSTIKTLVSLNRRVKTGVKNSTTYHNRFGHCWLKYRAKVC